MPYLLSNRTANMPRAGQFYYRNTYLVRNEGEVGITNGWSVGVVYNPRIDDLYETSELFTEAIYTNADFGTQLYSRIGIPIGGKFRLGAVLAAQLRKPTYINSVQVTYLGQLLATIGDPRTNITLGYTFRLGDRSLLTLAEGNFTVGMMYSLSSSLTFISDNSIRLTRVSGELARLGAALRIYSRRHSFDLGVLSAVSPRFSYGPFYIERTTQFKAYPYVGYNVVFGRR